MLRDFPERIHSGECYSGNSLRKEGKTVRKLFERIAAVTWFITAFSWQNLLISSELILSLKTGI